MSDPQTARRGRPKRVPTFWPDFYWREEDIAVPVVESDIDRRKIECSTWDAAEALAKDLTEGRATWGNSK